VIDAPVDARTQQLTSSTSSESTFGNAVQAVAPRTNWTLEEISELYNKPLIELTYASVWKPLNPVTWHI
jgi:biotin synthase